MRVVETGIGRRIAIEAIGTAFFLTVIAGSCSMGERLTGGSVAVGILCTTIAAGISLGVLIRGLSPIFGAHFNPAVTFALLVKRDIGAKLALGCFAGQIVGAIVGIYAAQAIFAEPVPPILIDHRVGVALGLAEFVATFGLLTTIFGMLRFRPQFAPVAIGLYITLIYWFTGSTSFANPAVTIARSLSGTFAGIAMDSVPRAITAQILASVAAVSICGWLLDTKDSGHEMT